MAVSGRAGGRELFADDKQVLSKMIYGPAGPGRQWQSITAPLDEFVGKESVLRLFQRVLLLPAVNAGTAYWRNLKLE